MISASVMLTVAPFATLTQMSALNSAVAVKVVGFKAYGSEIATSVLLAYRSYTTARVAPGTLGNVDFTVYVPAGYGPKFIVA